MAKDRGGDLEIASLRPWRQRGWRSSASATPARLAAVPALVEQARADAAYTTEPQEADEAGVARRLSERGSRRATWTSRTGGECHSRFSSGLPALTDDARHKRSGWGIRAAARLQFAGVPVQPPRDPRDARFQGPPTKPLATKPV